MSSEVTEEVLETKAVMGDFHDAMIQIEMLFQSHILSFGYKEYTLENYADRRCFSEWKAREGCRDTDAMRAGLNIDGILRSGEPSENEVLTYVQYVLNVAELCRRAFNRDDAAGYDFDIRNYTLLLSRVRELLKRLNYDYRYVADKEFIFILPHDEAADAAIPDAPSDPLYGALTEYRSTTAMGDLEKKRSILAGLGETIRSYPDNLSPENSVLYSRIEFLLNNVHIRNDNREGDDRIERVASMTEQELESWYDETYRMVLLRILNHDNGSALERVDELAEECGSSIEAVTADEINSIMDNLNAETAETAEAPPAGEPAKEEKSAAAPAKEDRAKRDALRKEASARDMAAIAAAPAKASKNRSVLIKVVVAIVVADILFLLFLLYYFHLI